MIDGWISVLIVSLIAALSGLAALLIQSYRGECQDGEGADLHPDHDRRARIASVLHKGRMSRIPPAAAVDDASAAWRELLGGVKTQGDLVPRRGQRRCIRALDDGAIGRLGEVLKQDDVLDGVGAAQERRTR